MCLINLILCGECNMKEFKLKSFDNTEIYCRLWDDVENPKGVIQLVHGMSEYAAATTSLHAISIQEVT